MKTCSLLIVAVASLALVIADEGSAEAFQEKLKTILNECRKENATITPLSLCFFHKLGFQDLDGNINKDTLRAFMQKTPSHNDADFIDKVLEECGDRKGATAVEAAVALERCLKKNELSRCRGCTFLY